MACDYNIELTIKELKGGLPVGRMQGSQDAERVERSVVLPVCAYLLLMHLYGRDQAASQGWSLFQLKQRFTEALMKDHVHRVEQQWQRKWNEIKEAAEEEMETPPILSINHFAPGSDFVAEAEASPRCARTRSQRGPETPA